MKRMSFSGWCYLYWAKSYSSKRQMATMMEFRLLHKVYNGFLCSMFSSLRQYGIATRTFSHGSKTPSTIHLLNSRAVCQRCLQEISIIKSYSHIQAHRTLVTSNVYFISNPKNTKKKLVSKHSWIIWMTNVFSYLFNMYHLFKSGKVISLLCF